MCEIIPLVQLCRDDQQLAPPVGRGGLHLRRHQGHVDELALDVDVVVGDCLVLVDKAVVFCMPVHPGIRTYGSSIGICGGRRSVHEGLAIPAGADPHQDA